jgi:hypothetical protein
MTKLLTFPMALAAIAMIAPTPVVAESAPFDLVGPRLRVTVARGGRTLPLGSVPNLAAGDRISVHAELGRDNDTRYLLVAGFLRGPTSRPPKSWFSRAETWRDKKADLSITVPGGARQLVLFLAPDAGGFDAIVDAVRKQPGSFVRATQELNQASLDRARLDVFVERMREQERVDPDKIETLSPTLTRSLAVKLKTECLTLYAAAQAGCLTDSRESLLLADSHTSALADTLVGVPTDLAFQLSATPQGGYGYYSPYIGVVRDLARIFGAFQATQFRYIPTLTSVRAGEATLLLNAAPSFAKPKSVMVVAMPAIEPGEAPPLRRSDPGAPVCLSRPGLVLPIEGAPLIYATQFAHDMMLSIERPGGKPLDLTLTADAGRGGYVLAKGKVDFAGLPSSADAQLRGQWGFLPFTGPSYRLQIAPAATDWKADTAPLAAGKDAAVILTGAAPACVSSVELRGDGAPRPLPWKVDGADKLVVSLPASGISGTAVRVAVRYAGQDQATVVAVPVAQPEPTVVPDPTPPAPLTAPLPN